MEDLTDAEMLDWIEENTPLITKLVLPGRLEMAQIEIEWRNGIVRGGDLRDAIRKAMEPGRQGEP